MLAKGEIDKDTVDEFDKASKGKKLPERVSGSKLSSAFGKAQKTSNKRYK